MDDIEPQETGHIEARALTIGMWGNLFMGGGGVLAAVLSNSQAILVDGLFSLIGFGAAIVGRRISRNADAAPDKYRPLGYAADEAIFTTFRSLSLLGLVAFALTSSAMAIYSYLGGGEPRELVFAPMIVYFAVIGATCGLLWFFHHRAWKRTGQRSDVLRIESRAAAFDGLITLAAGFGLLAIQLLRDGFLAPVAPVGDSLIVIVLCVTVISRYIEDFKSGLGELAGVTARPEIVAIARRATRATVAGDGGTLHDLSVTKTGRTFLVVVYYEPAKPVLAPQVDALTRQLERDLQKKIRGTTVFVVISQHGRHVPDGPKDQKNPEQ
jgi:divalent metal cation (Fe/Co/Zn/Cd) transporter